MSGRCPRLKQRCRHFNPTTIGFILSALSIITSCITIVYFTIQMVNLEVYDYLYAYRSSNCIPINGVATNINLDLNVTSGGDGTCSNPWIMIFLLTNGRKAVTNPFAVQETRTQAIDDRSRIVLGNNYSCICRPSRSIITNDCSVWTQCIFNRGFIEFMQRDNNRYYYTYISFIIASAVSASLSIMAIPSTLQIICLKCKDPEYVEMR